MKVEHTKIDDLKIIHLDKYEDERGFFMERWNAKKFKDLGLDVEFFQDNHSVSYKNILRGLHYQNDPPQGKLVSVITGEIFDVAVDIRKDSKTYGQYFGIYLNAQNNKALWIPSGFAHGFCVISDIPANVVYKTSGLYNPSGESGIIYNDKNIAIDWPIDKDDMIISKRDQELPEL